MKWRGHKKRPLPPASRCTARWAAWPCRPPSGRRWSHHSPPPETHSISSRTCCNTSQHQFTLTCCNTSHLTASVHADMLQHSTPHCISSPWYAATIHNSQHQFTLTCCNVTPQCQFTLTTLHTSVSVHTETHLTASVHTDNTPHSISSHRHTATLNPWQQTAAMVLQQSASYI